jgi:hypothetical protein
MGNVISLARDVRDYQEEELTCQQLKILLAFGHL